MRKSRLASLLALVPVVVAQQSEWVQCGGIGWTGSTTCVDGTACTTYSDYYSQCVPGAASSSASASSSAQTTSSATSTSSTAGSTSTVLGLHVVAQAAGKLYFGSATDNPELTDEPYVAILSDNSEFGQITPGNALKWDATEPSRGTFSFTAADQIVDLAQANSQILRGHNCVWYNQLPSWVTAGDFNATELASIVATHCSTIVGNYAGQICRNSLDIDSWDVINEPLNDDGTMRSDVFYDTLGDDYLSIALNAARAADPNTKLYINDYNIEGSGAKATAMVNLVSSLLDAGVPVDGIGLQAHFIVGELPANIIATMTAFTDLGVEIAITELDIRMTLPVTDAQLTQQKADYDRIITGCNAVPGCIGVTVWDYTDKYSWVPSTFSGQGAACPWDENLVKKPAYDGIVAGFGF